MRKSSGRRHRGFNAQAKRVANNLVLPGRPRRGRPSQQRPRPQPRRVDPERVAPLLTRLRAWIESLEGYQASGRLQKRDRQTVDFDAVDFDRVQRVFGMDLDSLIAHGRRVAEQEARRYPGVDWEFSVITAVLIADVLANRQNPHLLENPLATFDGIVRRLVRREYADDWPLLTAADVFDPSTQVAAPVPGEEPPESEDSERQLLERMISCVIIDDLSPSLKAIAELIFYAPERLSYPDIAARLQITPAAARRRGSRMWAMFLRYQVAISQLNPWLT